MNFEIEISGIDKSFICINANGTDAQFVRCERGSYPAVNQIHTRQIPLHLDQSFEFCGTVYTVTSFEIERKGDKWMFVYEAL